MDQDAAIYTKLQEHLDTMPIGYPAAASGVELRLLRFLFTPEQARIALELDYRPRTAGQIHERLEDQGMSLAELEAKLEEMVDKGNTFAKIQNGAKTYANMPLVVGMAEHQGSRLTPEFLADVGEYFQERFAREYLSAKIPQTRVIPVRESIAAEHRIGTYDELRDIIDKAGDRIRIGECMCRNVAQRTGQSCKITARHETCMGFRDFADLLGRTGWGRPISREEALQIATKNEDEGLVLQPANEQEPRFICSCCGDCCGILRLAKSAPRPVDVVASNYYARVRHDLCQGCGTCVGRCQMQAVELRNDIAGIDRDRCIGCGLCVPTCPSEAICLATKAEPRIPPKDMEALYESIMTHKKTALENP
jgi:NAD-dependent dihydropyrimidine dehydrogenase PreA subunit